MSSQFPIAVPIDLPSGVRVAVVATRWNAVVVDELLRGCVERLKERGVEPSHIAVHRVPGAFELPVTAKMLAQTKSFDAIICIGCVVRGDTPHFDYVAGEAARGIQQVAIDEAIPVIFGVLTVNTQQQALDRTGGSHSHAGISAADAAVEMVSVKRGIETFVPSPPPGEGRVGGS